MAIGIFAAVLGLLIAAACIAIPLWVRSRRQRPDDDDTQAYLEEAGRSARDIARGNAATRARQEAEARSPRPNDPDGMSPPSGAGSA
jgi:hypothetical protein